MNMRCFISSFIKLSNLSLSNITNIRSYARWAHRRPARVFTSEEYNSQENLSTTRRIEPQNLDDNIIELNSVEVLKKQLNNQKQQKTFVNNVKKEKNLFDISSLDAKTHNIEENKKLKQKKRQKQEVKYTKEDVLNTAFDADGNFVYEKMKNNDPKIGSLMLMVKSRKLRDKNECMLLEGKRLIKEALEAGCVLQHLLFSRKPDIEYIRDLLPKTDVHLYKMAYRDMQLWSDLTTCPGIMGIFRIPTFEDINFKNYSSIPLTIICDNIREPGNLGAILRAAVAVGAEKIILTKGCVDLWLPKVLRSSCGAHFRSPIHKDLTWDNIIQILPKNKTVFLADNNVLTSNESSSENLKKLCLNVPVLPYYSVNFEDTVSNILIIGGETMGLSEESYKLAFENQGIRLNIPLNNNIESLNTSAALGIIAFEIKRQLLLH